MEVAMRGSKLTGSFVALVTPFNKDGSVDFAAFRALLRFQEQHGTKAVLIMGSTGEATIANVRFAGDNGADGAILAAPAYICAPEADIERFFLDVADATDLPLGI